MAGHNRKPQPATPTPALQSFRVSRPQPSTRLHRLLVIFFTLTALLGAYFSSRPVHKTRSNKWWMFDIRRINIPHASSWDNSVKDKIDDLAKTLGVPPRELASAIAVAVRNHHAPLGSDSSFASKDASALSVVDDGFEDSVCMGAADTS